MVCVGLSTEVGKVTKSVFFLVSAWCYLHVDSRLLIFVVCACTLYVLKINSIPQNSYLSYLLFSCPQFNPNPSRVLGVFGLSLYTGEKDLKEMFSKYGPIEEVQVVYDHQTGRSRGFAFIYFEDSEDAIDVSLLCLGEPLIVDVHYLEIDNLQTWSDFGVLLELGMGNKYMPFYG